METIMVTGGLGFTARHITKRLAAGGRRVVSYNRDFAPSEDEFVMAQGELFDVARLVRVLKVHGIRQSVQRLCRIRRCRSNSRSPRLRPTLKARSVCSRQRASLASSVS
jgi:nucleoside-diphosphate-sugar epimerase